MKRDRSKKLLQRARGVIPGGVNSPVRAFRAVGGEPPFIAAAAGAFLYDADGGEYLDYVGSWGPMILGHAHPVVVDAVRRAAEKGASYGAPTEAEVEMAEAIRRRHPSMEKVRLVSSGTEAGMSAIRLARGFTGRDAILKFEGCYHGHADSLLVKAGSGGATFDIPDSLGVPADFARHTRTLAFNDAEAVRALFAREGDRIACAIVEPVAGNMGLVPPAPGFLDTLREVTEKHGALLILDEVMTGYRVALGGAQALYGLRPDLTMLGKVIGGGLPVGAFGGRADVMDALSPLGGVYQAGTLSGNPLAMAAGLATLALLEEPGVFDRAARAAEAVCAGLLDAAREAGVPLCVQRVGTMFTAFFQEGPVTDFASAKRSDAARFGRFHAAMLDRGVYLPPSQFEAAFASAAHSESDVARTLEAARAAMRAA